MVTIYGFISLINHNKDCNIMGTWKPPCLNVNYASKDIKEGEEIFIDYLDGAKNERE